MRKSIICILLALLAVVAAKQVELEYDDKPCKTFTTCPTCLNITAPKTEGGRKNCGWCHHNIVFKNGTTGPRCADIREPWICKDLFDTFKCVAGWICNQTEGKCSQKQGGEGVGSNTTCMQYCHPHVNPDQWKCNITDYQCQKCKQGDPDCKKDKTEACAHCQAPATSKYKCDKTDMQHPKCNKCKNGTDTGCMSHSQACDRCVAPQDRYSCNNKTLKCEKDQAKGMVKAACGANCQNSTPAQLLGDWRGLMVKNPTANVFTMGEFDVHFGNANCTFTWPNKTTQVFEVKTTPYYTVLVDSTTGKSLKIIIEQLANLKHTTAVGVSTNGWNMDPPDSFTSALNGEKSTSFVLWKCNGNTKGSCDFSGGPSQLLKDAVSSPEDDDACNKYPNCHDCITSSDPGIKCGWCMGGNLNYHGTPTKFKCGGYKESVPYKFTCPTRFQTIDCKGFACNWTSAANATCYEKDPGDYATKEDCLKICKPPNYQKCDLTTKKCMNCTPGTEKECLYSKDVCDVRAKLGKCKKVALAGLYRGINVAKNYKIGEYDFMFSDKGGVGQYYVTSRVSGGKGDMEVTGDAEGGATAVKFTNWKDDGGLMTVDTFYAVYKVTTGYAHFFNFLEFAVSPKPITQLDEGLAGGENQPTLLVFNA